MTVTNEELLRRIEWLEAIEAVRHTISDYLFSLDSGHWDELAGLFAEDAVLEVTDFVTIDGTYRGRDAIRAFYASTSPNEAPRYKHHGTNLRIDVDGDEALAVSYLFYENGRGGVYQERLRREADGRWRIVHKRITFTSNTVLTVNPSKKIADVLAESV